MNIKKDPTSIISIASILQSLQATGWTGFEGLVATLLSELSGHSMLLASAGLQFGVDFKTSLKNSVHIAVECKRYHNKTPFNQRELIAEIRAAITKDPNLDCWILATTRPITVQEESTLEAECKERGIEYLSLGCAMLPNIGHLDALCASQAAKALEFLKSSHVADSLLKAFKQTTQVLAGKPETAIRVKELRHQLSASNLGFPIFQEKLNSRLSADMSDSLRCKHRFRCAIGPHAIPDGLITVPRPLLRNHLHQLWIGANNSSELCATVVLGNEGDGKSWIVADWLMGLISTPDAPAVFFFSAGETSSSIETTLLSHAHKYADVKPSCDVPRLLDRWLCNAERRRAVIVFDGLNERLDRVLWSDLVASALQKYGTSIFLVLTCRQQTWESYYRPVMLHKLTEISIGPFNDQEFAHALSQLPEQSRGALLELGTLVRRPRYFHCACEHARELNSTHELSIPLLYYLDWRHRQSRRPLLGLNTDDFEHGLMKLAKRQYEAMRDSCQTDVSAALGDHDFGKHLEELRSGGVLRQNGRFRQWQVVEPFLALGLGMYLASLLEEKGGSIDDRCELASVTLGDTSSWDLTADIMQQTLQHALHATPPFSLETQVAILTVWTQCLNSAHQAAQALPKLAALQPELIVTYADRAWRASGSDHLVETAVLEALIRIMRCPDHQELASKWLCYWVGAVHQFGESTREDSDPAIPLHEDVDRLCHEDNCTLPSSKVILHRAANRTDIRLGRLALAALSACNRRVYWQVLVTAIVADETMGNVRSEVLRWIVRSSAQPIDDLVDATVTALLSDKDVVCDRAARKLIKFLGSPALMARLEEIPPDPSPRRHPFQDDYDADPCSSFILAPPRSTFINCLSRTDLPYHILADRAKTLAADRDIEFPEIFSARVSRHAKSVDVDQLRLSMGQSSEDLKWQNVEHLLCRIDPDLFASIIKRFTMTAKTREKLPLRQLSWSIREYADIFGPDEVDALYSAWKRFVAFGFPTSRDALYIEGNLAETILPHFAAGEQYDFLRYRPQQARELLSMEKFFKHLSLEEQSLRMASAEEDPRDIRISLWFLVGQSEINEEIAVALIKAALRSDDSGAKGLGLELLHRLDRTTWLKISELQTWTDRCDACCVERFYGTSAVMLTSAPSAETLARCCKNHMGSVLATHKGQYATLWDECYAELLIRTMTHLVTDAQSILLYPEIDIDTGDKKHPWIRISLNRRRESSVNFIAPISTWGGLAPGGFEALDAVFKHMNEDDQSAAHEALDAALKEAAAQNDWLFAGHIPPEAIERIVGARPSFIDEFEDILKLAEASRRIGRIQPVLEGLTAWGLRRGLQNAERWFDLLETAELFVNYKDSVTGLSSRAAALLAAPLTPSMESRWRSQLEDAHSDHDLFLVIFTLSMNGHHQWLQDEAIRQLYSQSPRGRSLCISIFAALTDDDQTLHNQLRKCFDVTSILHSDLIEFARQYRQRGTDYLYWIREAIDNEDTITRLRSARLARHIEDNRASQILDKLWSDKSLSFEVRNRLQRQISLYKQNSPSEWAKKLDKQLFWIKKLDHNVAPWLPLPQELQRQ